MLLPMILVRSQIKNMLGGEISKIIWEELSKEIRLCAVYWYSVRVWTSRLLVLSL